MTRCYYDDDYFNDEKVITCDCCTKSLKKLIHANFENGDIIGLTFIYEGMASIATGRFVKVVGAVVVVKDLLLEDTTSFVPLCDISSVEKGIIATQASKKPLSISLTK